MNYDTLVEKYSLQAGKIMRAKMIMCDAVAEHKDGTVTLFRAGIDRATSPGLPAVIRIGFWIRFDFEKAGADTGQHKVAIQCKKSDGTDSTPEFVISQLEVKPNTKSHNYIVQAMIDFKEFDTYTYSLNVDDKEMDSWIFILAKSEDQNA